MSPKRRSFLTTTGAAFGVVAGLTRTVRGALAQTQTTLEVAYAGSMTSVMEGPIKQLAAQRLGFAVQGRAQGASGLAQLIAGGAITPDVFISVTPSPILTVVKAAKIDTAGPIARTEMVIAYGPQSPFAARFADAGKPHAQPWWQLLESRDLRLGRTDPATDPAGRNTIFVLQLAETFYRQPGLARRILGADVNPSQIFSEPTIEARLQSGELDAAGAYKIQPAAFKLPYVELPSAINLSDARHQRDYAAASIVLGEKTFHPEPLVYYAAVVKGGAHPSEAAAFVRWLGEKDAQDVFRRFGYDPAGNAPPLHA